MGNLWCAIVGCAPRASATAPNTSIAPDTTDGPNENAVYMDGDDTLHSIAGLLNETGRATGGWQRLCAGYRPIDDNTIRAIFAMSDECRGWVKTENYYRCAAISAYMYYRAGKDFDEEKRDIYDGFVPYRSVVSVIRNNWTECANAREDLTRNVPRVLPYAVTATVANDFACVLAGNKTNISASSNAQNWFFKLPSQDAAEYAVVARIYRLAFGEEPPIASQQLAPAARPEEAKGVDVLYVDPGSLPNVPEDLPIPGIAKDAGQQPLPANPPLPAINWSVRSGGRKRKQNTKRPRRAKLTRRRRRYRRRQY